MNTLKAKESWNVQKEKLKEKLDALTDNDLMFEEGKKDEMLLKLQARFGKTKDELNKIITSR